MVPDADWVVMVTAVEVTLPFENVRLLKSHGEEPEVVPKFLAEVTRCSNVPPVRLMVPVPATFPFIVMVPVPAPDRVAAAATVRSPETLSVGLLAVAAIVVLVPSPIVRVVMVNVPAAKV